MVWLYKWIERILWALVIAFRLSFRDVPPGGKKYVVMVAVLPGACLIGYLFHLALEVGRADSAPTTQSHVLGAVSIGAILVVGWALYWFRENRRFMYACLELSAAMATAFHAIVQLSVARDRMPGLVAYLGALYIAVRGYDNLEKSLNEKKI